MKHMNKNKTKISVGVWILFFMVVSAFCLPAASRGNKSKFQVQLYGGLSNFQPKDFNMIAGTDTKVQNFMYDVYYNYLFNNHSIVGWSKNQSMNYGEIKSGVPLGFRLKYKINSSLSVSLGLKYLLSKRNSDPSYDYERRETAEYRYVDAKTYDEYALSVNAAAPLVGLHVGKKLEGGMDIEGFICGGPLFGRCRYKSDWNSSWTEIASDYSIVLYRDNGSIEERGTGAGFILEGGLNLNIEMGRSLGLFIEGVYAFQKISSLSGTGFRQRGNSITTWEGEWGMKKEEIQSFWVGNLPVEYPTNLWESGEQKSRDFRLDLSGLEFRVGLMFRF